MRLKPVEKGDIVDDRSAMLENAVVPYTRKADFVRAIEVLWRGAQEKFVAIGRYLNQAKLALPHGEFEEMINRELPFGRNVAHQLRVVAESIDSGRLPVERLPKNYSTVYLIARFSDDEREKAIQADIIRPNVRRAEVLAFREQLRGGQRSALLRQRERLLAERRRIDEQLQEIARQLGTDPDVIDEPPLTDGDDS
jgi:hypothetical protein